MHKTFGYFFEGRTLEQFMKTVWKFQSKILKHKELKKLTHKILRQSFEGSTATIYEDSLEISIKNVAAKKLFEKKNGQIIHTSNF